MPNPIPRVLLPIQPRTLDIYLLEIFIEVDIANRGRCIGELIHDTDCFEEGRGDEVDVLPWIGKQAEHGEESEGGHCARVVVAG